MRGRIAVAGSLAQKPHRGGHTWVLLQWLLGLRRLGWEVLFLDRLDPAPFSIDVGNQVPRIEAALDGLRGYVGEVIADRQQNPRDDLVTTLVGMVVLVRLTEVFPFAFGDTAIDWSTVMRVALIVGIVGTAIGKFGIGESMKSIWPFWLAAVAVLMVVTVFPQLSVWLPAVFRA